MKIKNIFSILIIAILMFSCNKNSVVLSEEQIINAASDIFPITYHKMFSAGQAQIKNIKFEKERIVFELKVVGSSDFNQMLADLIIYSNLVYDKAKEQIYLGKFEADKVVTNLHYRYEKAFLNEFIDSLAIKAKEFPVAELKNYKNYKLFKNTQIESIQYKRNTYIINFI